MNSEYTVVTFQSEIFNSKDSEEYFINSENFGDDLARWLADKIRNQSIEIIQMERFPGQEDFGWFFDCLVEEVPHCIVVGHHYDGNDFEWVIWLERKHKLLKSLLGARKRGIHLHLVKRVNEVLSESDDIRNVKWYSQRDFDNGRLNKFVTNPF